MKITQLKLNHITNPMGYDLTDPTVSYVVEDSKGKYQETVRVTVALDEAFSETVYDSGMQKDIVNTAFVLPIRLEPRTRYFWKVAVTDDAGDYAESEVQWFETALNADGKGGKIRQKTDDTGKQVINGESGSADSIWQAKWITPSAPKDVQSVIFTDMEITKPVRRTRVYMTGLGVYEFYLDGEKQGDECLLPGFCDYDSWIQYQTYAPDLKEGTHRFEIVLGDGWYKGVYGMVKKCENYGDRLAAIAQIHIAYEDGTEEIIATDETWKARRSRIVESGIYSGEVYDASADVSEVFGVEPIGLGYERLCPRLSPPITVHEHIKPIEVITSPKGETILDMGQIMTGWISFWCSAPAGHKIFLQTGEILQESCFYRDNLRTAKSEFTYISDGQERLVRQHFTFYGFRYVKVEGWTGELNPDDFTGLVIHSELDWRSSIETSDPLVNQLIHNARWGMKGNFLDVPTDCPQRDERYGWTGDAQIFTGTASFFADTFAFYTKYGKDLWSEQQKLDGSVPDVVPVANYPGDASTAWADAATIIPWTVYLHSGDAGILRRQYESMKSWVDYMYREDEKDGGKRLWQTGTHYADWLALDGNYPGGVFGRTDPNYIASGYYYYSTTIMAKTARILDRQEDADFYGKLASEIREAFIREYFTPAGKLAEDTMTAYVVALHFGLTPEGALERTRKGLLRRLKKNYYHLETGFVGTPYLCRVLSENGMNDLAYHLLMEKGYPGWLYEVLMGATTVWERWNSVMPDGKISGTEMNSLNHYSYGSIVEWMFRDMCGINPQEEGAGFRKFVIAPKPGYQIQSASAVLQSAAGKIASAWEIRGKKLYFRFEVPFNTTAMFLLPDVEETTIRDLLPAEGIQICKKGGEVYLMAEPGTYEFEYEPTMPCRKVYSLDSTWEELKANPKTMEILKREFHTKEDHIPFEGELCTLEEMTWGPFTSISQEQRNRVDALLREVE